jgi:hypothetical protein
MSSMLRVGLHTPANGCRDGPDYRRGQVAAKQAAGFTLYSAGGSATRGIHSLGGHRGAPAHDRYLSELLSL